MAAVRCAKLSEVAEQAIDTQRFALCWREFLDDFYRSPSREALADEPRLLRERFDDEGYADAFLAAMAAHLSRAHRWPVPDWACGKDRIASRPFFALRSKKGWALLLQEAPAEFRARNLFVTANALTRI